MLEVTRVSYRVPLYVKVWTARVCSVTIAMHYMHTHITVWMDCPPPRSTGGT